MFASAGLKSAQRSWRVRSPAAVARGQCRVVEGPARYCHSEPEVQAADVDRRLPYRAPRGPVCRARRRVGQVRRDRKHRRGLRSGWTDARVAGSRSAPSQGPTLSQRSAARDSGSSGRARATPRSSTRRGRVSAGDLELHVGEAILHGHRVSYRTAGEGRRVILLIHGITGDSRQ
jgi:hypothetical protein